MPIDFTFTKGSVSNLLKQHKLNDPYQQTGAVASFTGIVRRDVIHETEVIGIEFTSHEKMAEEICQHIMTKNIERHQLHHIRILHSLGHVKTGAPCFYVEVHAVHRKEAFAALSDIVDEFKSRVPVYGKELLNNNNYVWKENKY